MPHDKHGQPLAKGDRVLVECEVMSVSTGEEYCNVTLETVEPMWPGDYRTGVTLNARQVVKLEG